MSKREKTVNRSLQDALGRASRQRDGGHMNRAQRVLDEVKAATGVTLNLRTIQSHLHAIDEGRADGELATGTDSDDPWEAIDAALDGDSGDG